MKHVIIFMNGHVPMDLEKRRNKLQVNAERNSTLDTGQVSWY